MKEGLVLTVLAFCIWILSGVAYEYFHGCQEPAVNQQQEISNAQYQLGRCHATEDYVPDKIKRECKKND